MSLAKGLEFRAVAVMACDEGILPLDERVADAADEAELDDIYETERRLLYVACTRAPASDRRGTFVRVSCRLRAMITSLKNASNVTNGQLHVGFANRAGTRQRRQRQRRIACLAFTRCRYLFFQIRSTVRAAARCRHTEVVNTSGLMIRINRRSSGKAFSDLHADSYLIRPLLRFRLPRRLSDGIARIAFETSRDLDPVLRILNGST